MTALSSRIAPVPLRWRWSPARGVERAQAFLALIVEAFAESQDMARKAHKRHPFIEW